jgi:hypothetical protein
MSPEENGALEYQGVYVDERMIAEMAGAWPAVRVPRADIISIEVARGSESQRPIVQFLFGVLLLAMGLFPIPGIIRCLGQGKIVVGHEAILVVWLFLGIWVIYDAVKRRTLLLLRTPRGTKKIAFHGAVDAEELEEFLRLVKTAFGYTVESRGGDAS